MERRAGELLREIERAEPSDTLLRGSTMKPREEMSPTLSDLGIARQDSTDYGQEMREVPVNGKPFLFEKKRSHKFGERTDGDNGYMKPVSQGFQLLGGHHLPTITHQFAQNTARI